MRKGFADRLALIARRAARLGHIRVLAAAVVVILASGCSDDRLHVTIIGIDGATWRVLDPLLARGELPNFERLIASGVRAPLRSEPPLISPPIWTTIATGVSRSEHGIRRFAIKNGELISARQRMAPALWTLASRRGLRSAVIGWWGTYPAESIHGVVVSERALKTREEDLRLRFDHLAPAHLARLTHPPDVLGLLAETLFKMPQRSEQDSEKDWLLQRVRVEDAATMETLIKLRDQRGDFDLEMILLRGVDPVSHAFWRYFEPGAAAYRAMPPHESENPGYATAVEDQYRLVDSLLGDLLALAARDRVILLVSDHGFEAHLVDSDSGLTLTGHHRSRASLHGIFIAAGGPIQPGASVPREISIYDIAPTVLHLLGLDVADNLEGEVLTGLLEPGWTAKHPVRRVDRYSGPPVDLPDEPEGADGDSAIDERLRDELRALGYIE